MVRKCRIWFGIGIGIPIGNPIPIPIPSITQNLRGWCGNVGFGFLAWTVQVNKYMDNAVQKNFGAIIFYFWNRMTTVNFG